MDLVNVTEQTIEKHFANYCTHAVVHYRDLVYLICDFVGDYNIVKNLELRTTV